MRACSLCSDTYFGVLQVSGAINKVDEWADNVEGVLLGNQMYQDENGIALGAVVDGR